MGVHLTRIAQLAKHFEKFVLVALVNTHASISYLNHQLWHRLPPIQILHVLIV